MTLSNSPQGRDGAGPGQNTDRLKSAARTLALMLFAIALNCLGSIVTRWSGSLLYLDMAGTALASLAFGPLHGATVGLASNLIMDANSGFNNIDFLKPDQFRHYFLFGQVQLFAALIWSVVPRLFRGRFGSDIFCDRKSNGKDLDYPSAKIFLFILFLTGVSALAAAVTVTVIYTGYAQIIGCAATGSMDNEISQLCVLKSPVATLLKTYSWGAAGSDGTISDVVALFAVVLPLNWLNHIACFSIAFILISFVFEGRRYRLGAKYGRVLITNRASTAIIVVLVFLGLVIKSIVYQIQLRREFNGGDSVLMFSMLLIAIFFAMFLLLTNLKFDLTLFDVQDKSPQAEFIYMDLNTDAKDAFEDLMKFTTLFTVILHFFLVSVPNPAKNVQSISAEFLGSFGIFFLLSLTRQATLIFARLGRYIVIRQHPTARQIG